MSPRPARSPSMPSPGDRHPRPEQRGLALGETPVALVQVPRHVEARAGDAPAERPVEVAARGICSRGEVVTKVFHALQLARRYPDLGSERPEVVRRIPVQWLGVDGLPPAVRVLEDIARVE